MGGKVCINAKVMDSNTIGIKHTGVVRWRFRFLLWWQMLKGFDTC
jgi:hypothetical protein